MRQAVQKFLQSDRTDFGRSPAGPGQACERVFFPDERQIKYPHRRFLRIAICAEIDTGKQPGSQPSIHLQSPAPARLRPSFALHGGSHPGMNGEFETAHVLSFENVSKVYDAGAGSRYALRGVSFVVEPARKVAIVGRSGSGKSTLLHLAAGIDVPTGGTVKVGERDLSTLSEEARTKLRRDEVGLIFQFFYLMPALAGGG